MKSKILLRFSIIYIIVKLRKDPALLSMHHKDTNQGQGCICRVK